MGENNRRKPMGDNGKIEKIKINKKKKGKENKKTSRN